jgi:hypothetical protein
VIADWQMSLIGEKQIAVMIERCPAFLHENVTLIEWQEPGWANIECRMKHSMPIYFSLSELREIPKSET